MTRIGIISAMMVAAAVASVQPAAAASWRDFGGRHDGYRYSAQAQRQHPGGGGPPGGMQRQPPPDFRRAERMPEPERRPDGRLTEEERRDLRRDLDRANREIYKGRQRQ